MSERNRQGVRRIPDEPKPKLDTDPRKPKRRRSKPKPETLGPVPARPPWMDSETWTLLVAMRERLR